jgi:hypothetical protein
VNKSVQAKKTLSIVVYHLKWILWNNWQAIRGTLDDTTGKNDNIILAIRSGRTGRFNRAILRHST